MFSLNLFFSLTLLICLSTSNSFAFYQNLDLKKSGYQYRASIQLNNYRNDLSQISKMDIDIAGVDKNAKVVDVLISNEEYEILLAKNFQITIYESKGVSLGPDDEYKTPLEIEEQLLEFSQQYPHLTKLVSIGKSLEGRDIWAIKVSDNAQDDEYISEPAVLFNSMHHAREVMTPEVSLDIIEFLLTNYDNNLEVKRWVDSSEIWIIPMFNVDGNNKMWTVDAWWRKNTRGGYGVDLNRNYPSGWNSCNGSSGNRSSQTYRGDSPGSEPETQAMMNFVEKIRPVFDISYHAFSEIVIYPYGCDQKRTQTKEIVEGIGREIATLIDYEPGTSWELLYSVDGGDIDWMYEAFQVIPYVIEVNSRWQGFHPNYKRWRNRTVERNRAGWQHLLKRLNQSGIRGRLLNGQEPVSDYFITVNKVTKSGKSLFQNYVGHKTGMFHLVLNSGEYELIFNYNGKKKAKNIIVKDKLVALEVQI